MRLLASFAILFAMIFTINHNAFAAGDQHQSGNVIYQVPSGYQEQRDATGVYLLPQRQSLENAEIFFAIVSNLGQAPANMEQVLNAAVEKMEKGREVIHRESNPSTTPDGTTIVMELSITRVGQQVGCTLYVLANPGGKAQLLAAVAKDATAFQKYDRQLKEFFGGISFANAGQNQTARQYNNRNNRYNNSDSDRSQEINRQMQRNYTNQIQLNSITYNYNMLFH